MPITMFACLAVACGGTVIANPDGHAGKGGASGSEASENGGPTDGAVGTGSQRGDGGRTSGGGAHGGKSAASGGSASTDSGGAANGGAGSGGEGTDASMDIPPDLRKKPSVWIGQTSETITLPERADANQKDKPQKVVLILAAVVADQSVGGTITFGDGAPPPAPTSLSVPFPPREAMFPENWSSLPYAGFEYTVVWSVLTENHFSMAYVPSELFRDWCAIQVPRAGGYGMGGNQFCACSDTECHTVSVPIERVELVVHGDEMEGQLAATSSDQVEPIQIRLKRVN